MNMCGWGDGEQGFSTGGHIRRPRPGHEGARLGPYPMRAGWARPCNASRGDGPRPFLALHTNFRCNLGMAGSLPCVAHGRRTHSKRHVHAAPVVRDVRWSARDGGHGRTLKPERRCLEWRDEEAEFPSWRAHPLALPWNLGGTHVVLSNTCESAAAMQSGARKWASFIFWVTPYKFPLQEVCDGRLCARARPCATNPCTERRAPCRCRSRRASTRMRVHGVGHGWTPKVMEMYVRVWGID